MPYSDECEKAIERKMGSPYVKTRDEAIVYLKKFCPYLFDDKEVRALECLEKAIAELRSEEHPSLHVEVALREAKKAYKILREGK